MSTSSTFLVPLRRHGLTLATLVVAVTDHDVSVDAQAQALSVTPGVAGTYRLAVHVTSTPARGAGASSDATVDVTVTATGPVTLPAGVVHHRFKDFENAVGGQVHASVELLQQTGGAFSRIAAGYATASYGAAPAARTDQVYAIQNQSMVSSADAPAASVLQPCFDSIADVLAPVAGHPERTLWKFPALWCLLETARGTYDTGGYVAFLDTLFGYAQARGIGVYAMLGSAPPPWTVATATYGTATITVRGTTYTYVKGGQAPDSWTDLTDMVTWFVNRYQPLGLKVVGTPNEPNGIAYQVTSAAWAAYIKHIYDAVKAAQPTVEVHAPELAVGDTAYMDGLYASGLFAGEYDRISYHPYALMYAGAREHLGSFIYDEWRPMPGLDYSSSPLAVGTFIDSVLAHDSAARFWVSETGVPSGQPGAEAGTAQLVTPAQQATQWAYKLRGLARVPLVDGVTIFGLLDEAPARNGQQQNFGLMLNDRVSKKPAYATVKSTIAAIRAGTG